MPFWQEFFWALIVAEHINAYIVIITFMIPIFVFAKRQACFYATPESDFSIRRNTWILVATFAFLSGDFWLFVLLSSISILFFSLRDSNRLAMFCFLLFVVPPFEGDVSGFGVLHYLFSLNYPRLLSLLILLPLYFKLKADTTTKPFGRLFSDKCLLGFMVIPLVLQTLQMNDTLSNTLRSGFYSFLDIFLPYYVISRGIQSWKAFRDTVISLVLGIFFLAPIAVYEYLKSWLLYSSLPAALGLQWRMGAYLARGDDVRACAASGHALALGYLMVVALSLYSYVWRLMRETWFAWLGLLVLLAGIWAPVSRGPWLGALTGFAVMILTGPSPLKRLFKLLIFCSPVVAVLLLGPTGEKIISVLPFIGHVDEFNEIYRRRLFDISLDVIGLNPFFGSFTYLQLPIMQSLKQGQGIIDIVNSYIGVALTYGLVGLALFVGVFLGALVAVCRGIRASPVGSETHTLGRSLLATLVAVMVTIVGVSSINTIGIMNMVVVALCLSYGELVARLGPMEHRSGQPDDTEFSPRHESVSLSAEGRSHVVR